MAKKTTPPVPAPLPKKTTKPRKKAPAKPKPILEEPPTVEPPGPKPFDPINVPEEEELGLNADDPLSDKQRIFVSRYLTHWNATQAAREAGYKDPECSGYENRQKPAIQKLIRRKITEKCMGEEEVLSRLADVARGVHSEYWKFFDEKLQEIELEEEQLDGKLNGELNARTYRENLHETLRRMTPYLDVPMMVKCGHANLIKKFKTENGQLSEVEFHDMMAALTLIGRHLKMFTDKVEIQTDEPVSPDDTKPYSQMGRGELNSRIAAKVKPPRSR